MNLNAIAAGAIAAVNPQVPVMVQVSTGYTTAADGSRQPSYGAPVTISGQVQPLTTGDIRHLDSLNIQGVSRAIYLNGAVDGLVRPVSQGGDLITLPDGTTWLVKEVSEQWPNWVKCLVVLQNGS